MTAILLSLVAKFWPALIGVLGIAAGALFGFIKTKSASTTTAQAGQQVAQAQTVVAQQQASDAQADAAAALAANTAAAARTQADNAAAALAPGNAQQELKNDWSRD